MMNLRTRPLLARAIVAICCVLLVGAQIGSFTHALTHLGKAGSAVAETAQAKGTGQPAEAGSCDLCLSFGGLAHLLNPAPLAIAAPDASRSITAAAIVSAALAFVPRYRSRAPPAVLR